MKEKANRGFTLAEMLIVVAITLILLAVSFIAVQNHQRSMTRLEFDTIAKEIFLAAQNHLTAAESQGYLQSTDFGTKGDSAFDDKGERYFLVNRGNAFTSDEKKVLYWMLPFASVDETVRLGGSYIIRYQPSSAKVLDVFYSYPGRSSLLTVSGTEFSNTDYSDLMDSYRDNPETREHFERNNTVVGWYGKVSSVDGKTATWKTPEITIHNEEQLWVNVDNHSNNNKGSLKLIINGVSSKAQLTFVLLMDDERKPPDEWVKDNEDSTWKVLLDDITESGNHFDELNSISDNSIRKRIGLFIPGENITVEAIAYTNQERANIAYSGKKTTNSLFADLARAGTDDTATVAYIRHLENLDARISHLDNKDSNGKLNVTNAVQIKDLNWNQFKLDVGGTASNPIRVVPLVGQASNVDCYLPVSPSHYVTSAADAIALAYDGQGHKIENIKVDYAGDAGLFGELNAGSSVKNLELIDFDICASSTGNAGALVGKAGKDTGTGTADDEQINVENVIAYHGDTSTSKTVTATAGDAGGLIGSASYCTVSKSAAALLVKGSANAGGLIGSAANSSVTACYAGGHTTDGAYSSTAFNVTGVTNANAGGLIGSSIETGITSCYSTCSVSGSTAGGLLGYATASSAAKVSDCYCTGLVKGTTEGAFAGSLSMTDGATVSGQYFEIINEREDSVNGGFTVLPAAGSGSGTFTAFDKDAAAYDSFCGAPTEWGKATPYDNKLTEYYGGKYNLKRLPASLVTGSDFVSTHHGDWPAPEVFVFNSPST